MPVPTGQTCEQSKIVVISGPWVPGGSSRSNGSVGHWGCKSCVAQGYCWGLKEVPCVKHWVCCPAHSRHSVKPSSFLPLTSKCLIHLVSSCSLRWDQPAHPQELGAGHPLDSDWSRPHFALCAWVRRASSSAVAKCTCYWVKLIISPFTLMPTREFPGS